MFDAVNFRRQFPALQGNRIYLDSAATSLKPQVMIDATNDYYQYNSSSVKRGNYAKGQQTTEQSELARQQVANFIGSPAAHNIIWTAGTTAAVNFIAQTFVAAQLQAGDEIIVSEFEHHSNLLPWLLAAKRQQLTLTKWPYQQGQLDINWLKQHLSSRTKLIAITQMSNVTGYQPDLSAITELAQQAQCAVFVDGAQGIVHQPINVTKLGIEFYAFSAHKLYGPTGLGVLFINDKQLPSIPLWQAGGRMVKQVSFEQVEIEQWPYCFEAGTPNIAAIICFGAVLHWLSTIDLTEAEHYTQQLTQDAEQQLLAIPGFISYRA